MSKFIFTQSALKDLENEQTCPRRWYGQWVERVIPFPSNEHLEKGKYFEWLFLGSGAKKDEKPPEMPRLKNGEKSTDQLRIEAQAVRAKEMFTEGHPDYIGHTIVEVQKYIEIGDDAGTLDIVTKDQKGDIWVIDVKLTKDLTSDRTEYGWGNDWSEMDLIQQVHYQSLYQKLTGIRPQMALLVFDYSPQKRIVFGEIEISENKIVNKDIRFAAAKDAFRLYEQNGWTRIPNPKECDACPLACSERKNANKISFKKIIY